MLQGFWEEEQGESQSEEGETEGGEFEDFWSDSSPDPHNNLSTTADDPSTIDDNPSDSDQS